MPFLSLRALLAFACLATVAGGLYAQDEPAPPPALNAARIADDLKPQGPKDMHVGNLLSLESIVKAIQVDAAGLKIDFTEPVEILQADTTFAATDLYGKVYVGAYPFAAREAAYAYKRFSKAASISNGKAAINVASLFEENSQDNSEGWTTYGNLVVRLELFVALDGRDRALGVYDTYVSLKHEDGKFSKLPGIVEGPVVSVLSTDQETGGWYESSVTISFATNEHVKGKVHVAGQAPVETTPTGDSGGAWFRHEAEIEDLQPDSIYEYWVAVEETKTKRFRFRTPPPPGRGLVRFAFVGDSRSGEGGGLQNLMGVNFAVMEQLASLAYSQQADLLLMGGDLASGYTRSPADFRTQMRSWKQAVAGFASQRPVYTVMGNHEALMRVYIDKETVDGDKQTRKYSYGIGMDRWPYESESTEAVFQDEFVHPQNGPNSRRGLPTYKENVYSFQYGPVKFIAFNNNYWVLTDIPVDEPTKLNRTAAKHGGCPEGYVMREQMDWIRSESGMSGQFRRRACPECPASKGIRRLTFSSRNRTPRPTLSRLSRQSKSIGAHTCLPSCSRWRGEHCVALS